MSLRAALERPLPAELPPGTSTALFLIGTCAAEREPLEGLEVLVDGRPHPVSAFAMPGAGGERSRFWATVPVRAGAAASPVTVGLRARLPSGELAEVELGRIAVAEAGRVVTAREYPTSREDTIAVCMATFEPDMDLFRAQVNSLRAQTDRDWICLISDDASTPERFALIEAELAGDGRFLVSRSPERLGFYRNFERALRMVAGIHRLVALCDQDDRWQADKLATLRAAIGDAVLAYSDLRLVRADGRVLSETLWRGRSNNHTDLAAMLVANTITGAATLLRRELLDTLLPFPDSPGFQFHDHWLAVAALATGEVAYVDRPLYDYVQHRGAVFGHVTHGERVSASGVLHSIRASPTRWRAAYFYGYLAREVQAQALLARGGAALPPAKRRALERFVAAERSWGALAWLALRPVRALAGHTETLGSELELAAGVTWKRAATWAARRRLPGALASTEPPPLDAFTQKRLRRWRASIGTP